VAIHHQCLVQIWKAGSDGTAVTATPYNQHPYASSQQFRMNMMGFHVCSSLKWSADKVLRCLPPALIKAD
jgi:hypothetical protein